MAKSIARQDKDYNDSGRWKCSKSPTGAHHWIEAKVGEAEPGTFVCKYCFEVSKRVITFSPYNE